MKHKGPPLETLLRRIAETPDEFLAKPSIGGRGSVHVDAVVADLMRTLNVVADSSRLVAFRGENPEHQPRLSVALLLAWLLADDWFKNQSTLPADPLSAISEAAEELSLASADAYLSDPDRREEMARLILSRLDCRPAGETEAQAQDRLNSISAAERARVIKAAQAAEQRAREIREALAKKAAAESADKYTRE